MIIAALAGPGAAKDRGPPSLASPTPGGPRRPIQSVPACRRARPRRGPAGPGAASGAMIPAIIRARCAMPHHPSITRRDGRQCNRAGY
eukprot:765112-Hanusia_phi.AAC.5